MKLLHKETTGTLIGVYYNVYNGTGRNYPEYVYESAMVGDLRALRVHCQRQAEYRIFYKDRPVGLQRLDLFVAREVGAELKVVPVLLPIHKAQAVSYLKVIGKCVGLLFNFGSPEPEFERLYFEPRLPQNDLDAAIHALPEFPTSHLNSPTTSSAGCSRFTPPWGLASSTASMPMPAITNFNCVAWMCARKRRTRSSTVAALLARSNSGTCLSLALYSSFPSPSRTSTTSVSTTSKTGCVSSKSLWLSWQISTTPAFAQSCCESNP